jgi:hypothetical protein
MRVARLGEVSYNGVDFPIATKSGLVVSAVRDSADRTTKYLNYQFNCEFIVTSGDMGATREGLPLDDYLLPFIAAITEPGQKFVFSGQGAGDQTVDYNQLHRIRANSQGRPLGTRWRKSGGEDCLAVRIYSLGVQLPRWGVRRVQTIRWRGVALTPATRAAR